MVDSLHSARGGKQHATSTNRHQRRAAARQAFRDGVHAMIAETQGVVRITTVRPEDYAAMMLDRLKGRTDHLDLMRTVADLVARVTAAQNGAEPMLCAACPAELKGGYAVVVASAAGIEAEHGLGMGVCTTCGANVPSIERAALKGLRRIWPDMRPVTIHQQAGRA